MISPKVIQYWKIFPTLSLPSHQLMFLKQYILEVVYYQDIKKYTHHAIMMFQSIV